MREHKTFFLGSGFHLGSIKPTAPSSIDRALVPQLLPLLHKRPPVRVCALSNESGNLPPTAYNIACLRSEPDEPSDGWKYPHQEAPEVAESSCPNQKDDPDRSGDEPDEPEVRRTAP